jgi:hypothetical protein
VVKVDRGNIEYKIVDANNLSKYEALGYCTRWPTSGKETRGGDIGGKDFLSGFAKNTE